jgi:uroporphyrinogen-III synthase
MRILVTRPQPDADATAEILRGMGHEPVVAPLLEIRQLAKAGSPEIERFQAVLITSANGARALARATDRRDTQIYAVGAASAETARQAGFSSVESADGDVDTLEALVAERVDPDNGNLLHVTGSVTAGDLAGKLGRAGFFIEACQLYQANTVSTLPEAIEGGLQQHSLDAMLVFSPRTARTFMKLVKKAKAIELLSDINVFCLSEAVRAALDCACFRGVHVAERPEQDSLLRIL